MTTVMEDYDDVSHDSDSLPDKDMPNNESKIDFAVDTRMSNTAGTRTFSKSSQLLRERYEMSLPEHSRPIRVTPTEINFDGIDTGVLYVMTFSVKNASNHSQRIRIKAPKSMHFALNYVPLGTVAPGIETRGEIECQLPEGSTSVRVFDSIEVSMGNDIVTVPLVATKLSPNLLFENFVNLGFVSEGQVTTEEVVLFNDSTMPADTTMIPSADSRLTIKPAKFIVGAGEKITVQFSYEGKEKGPWREMVEVHSVGAVEPQFIDLSVQTVDQKLNLLADDNGGILDIHNFGALYYGTQKECHGLLVNTGPQQLSYSISYGDEEDKKEVAPQSDDGGDVNKPIPPEKFMTVNPRQGIIKPFSQVRVAIKFCPEMPPPTRGFITKFLSETNEVKQVNRKVFIDCMEMNQRLSLNLSGVVSAPAVNVSPSILRFGNCPVNDRRDVLLTLSNAGESAAHFNFSSVAHFTIHPVSGVIAPKQNTSVIASFLPSQLGIFKYDLDLSIENGLIMKKIHILAESDSVIKKKMIGGTDKLPEDFKKIYKFVDPEEVAALRLAKKEGTSTVRPAGTPYHRLQDDKTFASKSSMQDDGIYDGDDLGSQKSLASSHPHAMRLENDRHYNEYLKKSAGRRLNKREAAATQRLLSIGGIDRNDPHGVDLGMARGLDEPTLRVPRPTEPLWLANSGDGKKSRPVQDENRLIQKKYPSTPATQAEMRDCSTELDGDNLAMVSASHKLIDFGRVCVGSLSVKNLSIINELGSAISVKLEDLEMESKQSKPDAQVIPGGAVAGFDIYFSSKQLGKYKKSFSWKMNGHHSFRVVVIAEVVPIELEMNKESLDFEFTENSLENNVHHDILLKNTGNAPADFLWGNAGAFECKPDKGNIGPGQTAIISVVWTPQVSMRNEEELGLHIPGGIDKSLSVAGTVQSAKVSFEKGRLSLGTLAVGAEHKMNLVMKNTGSNPAVFFIDPLDERTGIRVSPERGLIEPGEKFTATCTVVAKSTMSYDNIVIPVSIRGNKPLAMKMNGESVVPVIELDQMTMDMPTIAVGSEYRAPMTLTNKSAISASAIINLKKYPEFRPSITNATKFTTVTSMQNDDKGNVVELVEDKDAAAAGRPLTENVWKVTLVPGAVLEASMVYSPTAPKTHKFKLPINILGLDSGNQFNCMVDASSLPSRLGISSSTVEFGDRVVSRDPLSRASYFLEVDFLNLDAFKGFSYEIRETQDDDSVVKTADDGVPPTFFISPTRGDIAPNGKSPIRLTFQPQESGSFSKRLEVYITDQPSPKIPYFTVFVRGSGVYPRLTFSQQQVTLPCVPLDVTSRAQFEVINAGYQALALSYKVSPAITVPLEITFPDGQDIGVSRERVRVVVSARQPAPMSWSGSIEFSDDDGERFNIQVSGSADNSLMSNYAFVKTYTDNYGFIGLDQQPPHFLLKKQISDMNAAEAKRKEMLRKQRAAARKGGADAGGSVSSTDGSKKGGKKKHSESVDLDMQGMDMGQGHAADENEGVSLELSCAPSDHFNDAEARFVLKWLNRNVMANPIDEERYPDCILENHGDIIVTCIEQLSGKKIPGIASGLPAAEPPSSRMGTAASRTPPPPPSSNVSPVHSEAQRLLKKYVGIIAYLSKAGALLTHINPIDLLDQKHHMAAQETHAKVAEGKRFTPHILAERQELWEKSWLLNCKVAWMEVIFQSLKVYALNRVNYPDYCKMPGIQVTASEPEGGGKKKKGAVPAEFGRSNVYSQAESILLAWISYHINHAAELKDEGASGGSDDASYGVRKRSIDFNSDLKSVVPFLQMVHSHMPDTAQFGGQLVGYTTLDSSDREAVFDKLQAMLEEVRLMFDFDDIEVAASGRSLMLMALHLYLNLPALIQKAKIEFSGVLGQPIKKSITLKNPSRKAVTYNVTLAGDSDFVLSEKEVTVPAQGSAEFVVTLNARFFETVSAKITFWGLREAGLAGRTIVFQLVSNITGRKPIQSIKHKLSLFEMGSVEMAIACPFPKDTTLPIKMLYHHSAMTVEEAASGKKPVNKSGAAPVEYPAKVDNNDDYEIEQVFKMPFWSNEESIALTQDGVKHVTINMLPFMMGLYTCHIILLDPHFGEFAYEVELEVGLPKSSDTLSFKAFKDGSTAQRLLRVASKNYGVDKAISTLSDTRMANSSNKGRARTLISSFMASQVSNDAMGTSDFVMELSSPFFQAPKQFALLSEYQSLSAQATKPGTAKKVSRTVLDDISPGDNPNNLPANSVILNFNPDKAGTYNTNVTVYSRQNRNDIRCFEISSMVTMPPTKMQINFSGPADHKLTQEIPIFNESDKDWTLSAMCTGPGFSGPKSLSVPKGEKVSYIVSFTGPSLGEFNGSLVVKNTDGADMFDYVLVGVAEEPLAADHLHFKCKARAKQTFHIPVSLGGSHSKTKAKADARMVAYTVSTDLQYISGGMSANVPMAGRGDYEFTIMCPVGGVMSGSITFTDPKSGNIIWYTMDIEVTSPKAESTIEVESQVRKAVSVDLALENPTNNELVFTVQYEGDGLIGDGTYSLPPKSFQGVTAGYELIYSPLVPGDFVGRISFCNDQVGEFWYKLHLVANTGESVELEMMESMLGVAEATAVAIENPLDQEVVLKVEISDIDHFFTANETIVLGPYAQTTFDVFFRASSLSEICYADMTVSADGFGEVKYSMSGKGLLPGVMPTVMVIAPLNEFGSHTIAFRNPFPHALPIDVMLHEEGIDEDGEDVNNPAAFGLLLRKAEDLVVPARSPLQISISFSPTRLGEYNAQAQVRSNVGGRSLLWCYPLTGMAEAGTPQYLKPLQTPCKTTLIKDVDIFLKGLRAQDMESGDQDPLQASAFNVDIVSKESQQQIARAFRVQPLELRKLTGNDEADYCMRYRLIFEPLRAFAAQLELVIECKNKGRWRAQLGLDASDPEPDDIVNLVAPVNGSDKVKFRLSNRFLGYSNFTAYFDPKSSPHFSVSPASGVLAPFGSDGSEFVIKFSPVTYGIKEVAYLTIVTDDAQWNYEVRGEYPDVSIDQAMVQAKTSSRR